MGKGSRRQKYGTNPKPQGRNDLFSPEKLDDEVDAFHKQRDVIPLDVNADAGYDLDEDTEHPVFEIEDDEYDSDGSGDDDDDDDGDDDGDIGDETQYTGLAAKIARQAKFLRQKGVGVEDDMHDDAESEEERKVWGRRKSMYYSADNIDFELQSSDEDLPEEEEAEVLRLQREKAKYLSTEDFGLKDADEDESHSDGQEKTLQDMLVGEKSITKSHVDGLLEDTNYEEVKKDFSALSKEEQMDVVYSSAPELVGLLSELNEALNQLQKVKPLLCKVKEKPDITKEGMHYFEVKQLLLLSYCQAIGFYLLLKSEGHPVRDHPVIARLVEINKLLEKVKQIDASLPFQIEEIVNCDGNAPEKKVVQESAALEVLPGVTNISAKTCQVTPAHEMSELVKVGLSKDYDRTHANKKDQNGQVGLQSMEMLKVRARLEEKLKQKGIYNTMPPRPDRTQQHALQPLNRRLETFADFDDEVTESAVHRGMSKDHTSSVQSLKLSQLVAAKVNKPMFISGDEDLPKRDDIGERRRKYELRVLARSGAASMDDDMGDEDGGPRSMSMYVDPQGDGAPLVSENEFYKQVKKQRDAKLSAKAELYSRTPAVPTLPEHETDGKRHITYKMEKNKGLTRSRKKLTKIPRKKYKIKHQKAVVRRKGQVRDIRKPTGPYGGEASGINIGISRSVRFKS